VGKGKGPFLGQGDMAWHASPWHGLPRARPLPRRKTGARVGVSMGTGEEVQHRVLNLQRGRRHDTRGLRPTLALSRLSKSPLPVAARLRPIARAWRHPMPRHHRGFAELHSKASQDICGMPSCHLLYCTPPHTPPADYPFASSVDFSPSPPSIMQPPRRLSLNWLPLSTRSKQQSDMFWIAPCTPQPIIPLAPTAPF